MEKMLFIEEKRRKRMASCLERRQMDLRLFLEDVQNYHNVSAIIRTADATGILYIYYSLDARLPINDSITCGAHKWVLLQEVRDKKAFLRSMRSQGFQVVATALSPSAKDFREIDYTVPTVIVMGNELAGVSKEVLSEADILCKIPMHGMVQSLNVSVATALVLYEAERQRKQKGMYDVKQVPPDLEEELLKKWGYLDVIKKKARGRIKHLV